MGLESNASAPLSTPEPPLMQGVARVQLFVAPPLPPPHDAAAAEFALTITRALRSESFLLRDGRIVAVEVSSSGAALLLDVKVALIYIYI